MKKYLHEINFGPKNVIFSIIAEYGPNGVGIGGQTVVAETKIICFSNIGRGRNHRWTLWIGHNSVSLPSLQTTSYMKPSILQVIPTLPSLERQGGETIDILGNNFGVRSNNW